MAVYKCKMCGYEYDDEKEGVKWEELPDSWECPLCRCPKELFYPVGGEESSDEASSHGDGAGSAERESAESDHGSETAGGSESARSKGSSSIAYDAQFARKAGTGDRHMDDIHEMAVSGEILHAAMDMEVRQLVSWDDILILGAQLFKTPLEDHDPVNIQTVIGKKAKKPMVLEHPVYVSHMSFGALSKEVKIALSKGSAMAKTAMCSGEGGILPEERDAAYKYIFEYVPNLYSVTPENLRAADAIEIKIGQGTKPGMGGHLPGEKVTEEIAAIRQKPVGQDIISPSAFPGIRAKEDLKELVDQLRESSGGRPIGVKIAAGHIEKDLGVIAYARPDFVTIDGRGGATGSSPKLLRDASSVPTIYALHRARTYMDQHGMDMELIITGGLRVSSDFAKAIAMGADAVAVASAPLIAAACQRYKICGSGRCPVGVATQDPELRKRLDVEAAARRVANFFNVTAEELKTFARISGNSDIHDLTVEDLCTVSSEISDHTSVPHA